MILESVETDQEERGICVLDSFTKSFRYGWIREIGRSSKVFRRRDSGRICEWWIGRSGKANDFSPSLESSLLEKDTDSLRRSLLKGRGKFAGDEGVVDCWIERLI